MNWSSGISKQSKRIIIDTDPGIDDALAILLALASPELQVEGLTIVSGNSTLDQGVKNALSILELGGRSDVPVTAGAARPLVQPLLIAPETHGGFGLGYATLPPARKQPLDEHAVQFIIERCLSCRGEISLVCIGPLTNLALALRMAPELNTAISEVIIMGGAIRHGGNTTPIAEFNTFCDPHAAHIVFHSGLPLLLVPLDVTYQVVFTKADVHRLLKSPSAIPQFIDDATRYYMEFHNDYQKIEGCIINDPLALALTFAPYLVDVDRLYVDVDISGGVSMGNTFADFFNMQHQQPNMQVALGVRPREFIEIFLERIESLCFSRPNK